MTKKYYDGKKLLSFNTLFNFIIGARSIGKTYWAKEWGINDFLKTGKQFAYIRRYSTEFDDKKKEKFFDDIKEKYPNHEFKVKGFTGYIDDKPCCHFFTLSKGMTYKSVPYPKVNKIFFDEFLVDGLYRYLPNEVKALLDLYYTIARNRRVRMFFLSNSISLTNPYFGYWRLKVDKNKEYQRFNKHISINIPRGIPISEELKNTEFGELIQGTSYSDFAINNEFYRDTDIFVENKKSKTNKYSYTIKYDGESYGVWWDNKDGNYFISSKIDESCKIIFSLKIDDHREGFILHSNSKMLKNLSCAFEYGQVRFENINIKNKMIEIFRRYL